MTTQTLSLEKVCSRVTSGGTPSRKQPDYYSTDEAGHLWIKSKELLDSSISGSEDRISDLGLKKSSAKYVDEGSVLIAMYGANVGQLGWLKKPATVNQAICSLTVNDAVANNRWLFYKLLNDRHRLIAMAQGAAQQNISQSKIKSFEIEVPPVDVQARIASILSAYDDLIENNTRRIEILEEMARRLYEEWFVHFRFPGHEEVSLKESELGEIPEGWEVASLESFGTILTGKTPSKKNPDLFGSEVPFIKLPDMHGQIFIVETSEGLSREGQESQRKKTVPANSICVSCIGTGGIVVITSEPSQTNQQINTVVPARSDLREFLYFSALSLRDDINNYGATGATMTNLSRGKFASLKVVAACEKILSSYSKLAAPMFDRILNLQRSNRNLRAQRDLLLPKLVSGEIDVSDIPMADDTEVEAA